MAAARYWRLVGIETYAGGDLELSEIHLYGQSGRVDQAATLTCSHAPIAGTLANLQDDNTATVCRFAGAAVRSSGFALQWDFGAPADVAFVRPASAASAERFVAACSLQRSDDLVSWVQVSTFGRFPWPGAGQFSEIAESGAAALVAWYDASVASSLTVSGGDVLGWNDISGGGRHFTVSQSGYRPSLNTTLLAKPCVDFSAGKFLEMPALYTGGNEWTVWMVLRRTVAATAYHSLGIYESADNFWVSPFYAGIWGSPPNPGILSVNNATQTTNSVNGVVSELGCACFSSKGDNTSVKMYWQSLPRALSLDQVRNTPLKFGRVGGDVSGIYISGGAIAELAVFGRQLTAAEIDALQVYAEGKWGLPVSGAVATVANPLAAFGPILVDMLLRTPTKTNPQVSASAPVPAHTTASAPRLQLARDVEVGGQGTIYGTTKAAGAQGAPGIPTKARVVLLHQRSKLPVRETWSDPVTGNYAFVGIDTSQQFLVLAEDAAGSFRPVAANRLTPEVAP